MGARDAIAWRALAQQAARSLRRDARNPHLVIVALALIVAVASMTAVATFTDRVQRALAGQASQLLAGDLALTSSQPIAPTYRTAARASGLQTSEQLSLRSMVRASDGLQMVELKAVSSEYPLRGVLRVAAAPFALSQRIQAGPDPGTVLVEARLLSALDTAVGARLRLGAAEFRIAGVLTLEPDRAGDLFSIAPRVLMHLSDIPATRLVLPGSRVQYSMLVAGAPAAVARFASNLKPDPDVRVITPAEARPEVRSALAHAEQFLSLAALVATVLAGLAIWVAADSFAREQIDAIAIMRTLGASRRALSYRYVFEILLLGLIAATIGAACGVTLEYGLARALSGWVQDDLPPASPAPAIFGLAAGIIALAGFALPLLFALRDIPPARVLRRDHGTYRPRRSVLFGSGVAAVVLLAPWQTGDPRITGWTLGALACCLIVLLITARLALLGLGVWYRSVSYWWRLGIANLIRFPVLTSLQICALGLSVMAIMLLGFVRTDLVTSWATSLPPNAPDQFLINIEPEEVAALDGYLVDHGIRTAGIYSMVRARLVNINAHPVTPDDYPDPRARRLADREFNLSAATQLKADNRIVAGRFWEAADPVGQFSFETDIAASLGIKIGDTVDYRIADRVLSGKVTSLREVNWETMEANFFVLAPPMLLAPYPATYITSFKLPVGGFDILRGLSSRFPSVTIIDVMALVQQIRGVMDKALSAIEFVFLFTVAAGVIVVFAAVQSTQGQRLHDAAVMKALGGTRRRIVTLTAVEFITLGILAGLIGAIGASLAAWLLATRVLHVGFHFRPSAMAFGIALGLGTVVLAGLRSVVVSWRHPAAQVLRDA